jgi:hypothetical protein
LPKLHRRQDPTSAPKDDSTQDESAQDEPAQDEPISDDEHYRILFHCLEYLKSFGQHGSASIMCRDGTGAPSPPIGNSACSATHLYTGPSTFGKQPPNQQLMTMCCSFFRTIRRPRAGQTSTISWSRHSRATAYG